MVLGKEQAKIKKILQQENLQNSDCLGMVGKQEESGLMGSRPR